MIYSPVCFWARRRGEQARCWPGELLGVFFACLCDVFVDAAHQGRGLGMFLARAATSHPGLAGIRQVLMAEPGRSMYRQLGFGVLVSPESWMERPGGNPSA
jgi:hypothetical protein